MKITGTWISSGCRQPERRVNLDRPENEHEHGGDRHDRLEWAPSGGRADRGGSHGLLPHRER